MTTTTAAPPRPATPVLRGEPRTAALTAGAALGLMTAVAPVAAFGLLPADRTGAASVLLMGVVVLDVVVAVALVPVLAAGGRLLAQVAGALRLVYAAAFASAIAVLAASGDQDRFTRLWDASLLVFGAHLLVVGLALARMPRGPRLVAALVTVAGVGYVADATLTAVAPVWAEASAPVSSVCALGEVALLVWLLARAGRAA
jgi:hypothetical protein